MSNSVFKVHPGDGGGGGNDDDDDELDNASNFSKYYFYTYIYF